MAGPLEGRTAVVTGPGQGIGRRIALRLASEGARLVLAGRTAAPLDAVRAEIEAAGGSARAVPTDLRDPAHVEALAAAVREVAGAADVVISNSGVPGPTAELWKTDPEDWDETFRVNVRGAFLLCRALLPDMIGRGAGSIVVIGSATGKRPLAMRTPYAASKAALIGLVRTLAAETGPHGVRVNLVSPGPVAGDRFDAVVERQAEASGISVAEARAHFLDDVPLRRVSDADDVAGTVAFLAGDDARAITGEDVNVSSGWVMHG